MGHKVKSISFLLLALSFGAVFSQQVPDKVKLSEYISKSLQKLGNPALAIALVSDTGVIFQKGFGYTQMNEGSRKVDENTLFFIASNTKAFTSSAVLQILKENELTPEIPVKKYLTDFEIEDTALSSVITVADLLSHRIGYKTFAGDLVWHGTSYNREEVMERIPHVPLTYNFREQYGYSNLMYLTAGQLVTELTEYTWENYIQTHFIDPLQMTRTCLNLDSATGTENIAAPYVYGYDGEFHKVSYLDWDNIAPAGSIFSCINDMSNWIQMWLNQGVYNGTRVLDTLVIHKSTTVQTPMKMNINEQMLWPGIENKGYAFGWNVYDYYGSKVIEHSGGALGTVSQVTMVPEKNLGFVIFTNSNNYLPIALHYHILDIISGKQNKNWSNVFHRVKEGYQNYVVSQIRQDLDSLNHLTENIFFGKEIYGIYHSEMYGDVEVLERNDSIICDFKPRTDYEALLRPVNHGYYTVEMLDDPSLPTGIVRFFPDNPEGYLKMEINIPNPDFDFIEMKLKKKKNGM